MEIKCQINVTREIANAQFSSDGSLLAVALSKSHVQLYVVPSYAPTHHLPYYFSHGVLAWHPTRPSLLLAASHDHLQWWNARTGLLLRKRRRVNVTALAWSPYGRYCIGGDEKCRVCMYDVRGTCLADYSMAYEQETSIDCVVFVDEDTFIVSMLDDWGYYTLLGLKRVYQHEIHQMWEKRDEGTACKMTVYGSRLFVSALSTEWIKVIDPSTREVVQRLGKLDTVSCECHVIGEHVLSGNGSILTVWDKAGKAIKTLKAHSHTISGITRHDNLLVSYDSNTLILWKLNPFQ